MGLYSKAQVLVATSICVFLLFVVFRPFHTKGMLKISKSNGNIQNQIRVERDTNVEKEPLQFMLRRLVRGEDRIQLDTTGFACHSDLHSDVCVANKPVMMDNKALRLYVPFAEAEFERTIRPYPRKDDALAMKKVTPLKISSQIKGNDDHDDLPSTCNFTHNVPALVFSSGGFTGNLFHELNEFVIPLFITSRHFRSNLRFVITDHKPWMVTKYNRVLSHLSRYDVINPAENGSVHCFPGAVIGLKYHGNLALNSTDIPCGYNMFDFKHFLRQAYNLGASHVPRRTEKKPLLILISRANSRVFLNEDEIEAMMAGLGFEVMVATPYMTLNLDKFSGFLGRCSVMVGAHGAGLSNALFLPGGAVVVQVVPLGLDWASNAYYGESVLSEMGLRYLEYKVEADESSLLAKYGEDHLVISDPNRYVSLNGGYEAAWAVYVDGQNLRINLVRFRETMVRAMELLGRSIPYQY